MSSLHFIDYAIVAAYFGVLLTFGQIASKSAKTGEGFFLAGRKLGKVYQFFLNFGNSIGANDAISTASVTYQQGISGIWLGFQAIFMNPYYWMMYAWYRRLRLMTIADIFEDRLGSLRLAFFYASFQIMMSVAVTMAFGNLVAYKISSALVTKDEASWTATERQAVSDYRELATLEAVTPQTNLTVENRARLADLRERRARNELKNYVSALEPWTFYLIYPIAVGTYIIMGGLAAAALNEAFQGVLIIVFSLILIPAGLAAIGGWHQLAVKLPAGFLELFGRTGSSDFTLWTIAGVFLATLMQAHAMPGNMGIAGSAKNEFAARFGAVTGTFGKRLLTIAWGFCGLIAVALYSGANSLADADTVWGTMSRQLLSSGLLGLMFAGVLAANMSSVASQGMAVSALFARNIYRHFRPAATDRDLVRVGRWTLAVVLGCGVIVSTQLSSVYVVMQFAMTINVPFGATILASMIWRRVTVPAVWVAVIGSALFNILLPVFAQHISALADRPALVARAEVAGRPVPVYFESVVRQHPEDPASPLTGRGRLHMELLLLRGLGFEPAKFTPGGRVAGRFFVDALLPFLLVIGVSLLTRPPPTERIDQFFGKLKTPVGATPELDEVAMAETRANPRRFDHLKLLPRSSFEWTRWDRVDTTGFLLTCLAAALTVGLLWLLLRFLAGPAT